jgi:heme exporter protein C
MGKTPVALKIIDVLSALMLATGLYLSLKFAPMEAVMGDVQRIFYFHVSAGWTGMIGFLFALFAAAMYLSKKDIKWDVLSVAGIEVGLVFSFINIATGSIWAKPIWNTYWNWDPRLVTATVMELVYIAYLMLRQGIEDPDRRARFASVYAIIGFVSVPLSFLSIRIWRTIHPVVIAGSDPSSKGSFDMVSDMRTTFFFSLATFSVLAISFIWHRTIIGKDADQIEKMKLELSD